MTERRRPKWIAKSKTFIFGLAVFLLGILEWVSDNVEFTGEQAGAIISAIGIVITILRLFTKQPASLVPPPEKNDAHNAKPLVEKLKEIK